MPAFVDDLHQALEKMDKIIKEMGDCQRQLVSVVQEHMVLNRKQMPDRMLSDLEREITK